MVVNSVQDDVHRLDIVRYISKLLAGILACREDLELR